MCGIAGIVEYSGEPVPISILKRMGESIAHRGPDDFGFYQHRGVGLSHRRLSIIDLSEHGHQPMANEDGSVWIVLNGEIYNYVELRAELQQRGHKFRSHSDTEVILHAYEEYGVECLARFSGMFAFALWDQGRETLFAARDRVGIKPFYYYTDGHRFVFGSEIKAILASGHISFKANISAIQDYVQLGFGLDDRSWFEGVRKLQPGHYVVVDRSKLKVERYWDLSFETDYGARVDTRAEELLQLLTNSIRDHLRSDVPVGAHLSGGVDSSSIVALMTEALGHPFHTFSGAFSEGHEYDERRYIGIVSNHFKTIHHEIIPAAFELPALLPRILWHLDQPSVGPSVFPQFRVCQEVAKAGIKVVNGGQGGDELFAGYLPYYSLAARTVLKRALSPSGRPPLSEFLSLPTYTLKSWLLRVKRRRVAATTHGASPWKWGSSIGEHQAARLVEFAASVGGSDPLNRAAAIDIRLYLQGLLHIEDRTSMAWSIESRVPLLDHRIVEFAASLPSWVKVRRGVLKAVLRDAMRGRVPDLILDRRDKMGFPTPTRMWFRSTLRPWVEHVLLNGPLHSEDVIDQSRLRPILAEHFAGVADRSPTIWAALNTELWYRGNVCGWMAPADPCPAWP